MTLKPPANQSKTRWTQWFIAFGIVLYLAMNTLRIGGDQFIINLNNAIDIPLILGVTLLALTLRRGLAVGGQNRLLWSGLVIGWAFWSVAEVWWSIATLIGQEVPYPSLADLFWLVGYIPMIVALWGRVRSLPHNYNLLQRIGIWVSILLSTAATILLVLIPIIQDNNPAAVLESTLNILYPLVDLFLLILVLQILFGYQKGMYGRAWMWLSAGFAIHSVSNLIFSYASTNNLYYPDGQGNLLSTVGIDVTYTLSYIFLLTGLLIMRAIQQKYREGEFADSGIAYPLVPNTHILVLTKRDDTVLSVSRNYPRVFPTEMVNGKTISELLGFSPGDASDLFADIKTNKVLKEKAWSVNTLSGQQQAWISGISVEDAEGEALSVMLLLRMITEDYALDELLTDYQKGMMDSLLSKTGTKEIEREAIKQLLATYYLAHLKGLYNRIFSEGGIVLADAFLNKLQSTAKQNQWQIIIQPGNLLDVSSLPFSKAQEALPVIFETAKRFLVKITDEATTQAIVQSVRARIDPATLRNIAHFDLAGVDRS
jgi:hypothetical protein